MGTILSVIEFWLQNTIPKALEDTQGAEWWCHLGSIKGVPVCVKLQWEPGYAEESNNPFVQQSYGLTVGLFEEHSALLVWDWSRLTPTCSLGPDQIQTILVAVWLSEQFEKLREEK